MSSKCDFNISFDLNDTIDEIENSNESFHNDEEFKVSFNVSFDNDLEPIQAITKTQSVSTTRPSPKGISWC